jgi:hypothetical protein
VADEFVYLKYAGRGKELSMHAEFGRPFVFEPYLRLKPEVYLKWKNLFAFTGEIILVPQEEYDAWATARAERAAALHLCGTYGGVTVSGAFCGKQVDGPGCRCEHHGGLDEELQGSYAQTSAGPPQPVNRGGRPRKVKAV